MPLESRGNRRVELGCCVFTGGALALKEWCISSEVQATGTICISAVLLALQSILANLQDALEGSNKCMDYWFRSSSRILDFTLASLNVCSEGVWIQIT